MRSLIDKKKKSNIYCAHCEHWSGHVDEDGNTHCKITMERKAYYQRCKLFEWRKDAKYKLDWDSNLFL